MAGCASGPGESDLLPGRGTDHAASVRAASGGEPLSGASSAPGAAAPSPSGEATPPAPPGRIAMPGGAIAPTADAETRRGRAALDDLQRDFQRVPNPEILGYVYPHLAEGMPVGYYTAFPLRDGSITPNPAKGFIRETRRESPWVHRGVFQEAWTGPAAHQSRVGRLAADGAAIPLERHAFAGLFQARPAFADYLPLAEYDADTGLFRLDDGVSVGTVLRLTAADLDGRSPERLAEFNQQLDHALRRLPAEDEHLSGGGAVLPGIAGAPNIADTLAAATPPAFRESAYSQSLVRRSTRTFRTDGLATRDLRRRRVRQSGEHARAGAPSSNTSIVASFARRPRPPGGTATPPGAALQAHDRAVSVEPGSRGYPGPAPGRRGAAALVCCPGSPRWWPATTVRWTIWRQPVPCRHRRRGARPGA